MVVSHIEAVLVVLLAVAGVLVTVNTTSLVFAPGQPLGGTVYLIVTLVFAPTLGEVYVLPVILPPPLTILQLPPPGVAVNALVVVSHIDAVLVVLVGEPGLSVTVKTTSSVLPEHPPEAAIV